MTKIAKCLKPSGSCWSQKEEIAECSELAIFLKNLIPSSHYGMEYLGSMHAFLSWLILMHVSEIKFHLIIKVCILKSSVSVYLYAVEAESDVSQ